MRFFLSVLLLLLSHSSLLAADCTPWQRQSGVSCTIAGISGDSYQRQCQTVCQLGPKGIPAGCALTDICSLSDPNHFVGPCSVWVKNSNTVCLNPNTSTYEQAWERSCSISGFATVWCSESAP